MSLRRRPLLIAATAILVLGMFAGAYYLFFGRSGELIVSDDPFSGIGSSLVDGEGLPDMDAGAGEEVAPRLIRVSNRPVAEGVIAIPRISTTTVPIENASGTPALVETTVADTEVRFIDRASGNIYKYLAHARSLTRISNKTLPGIQEASWLSDGSIAYVRFLGEGGSIASYVLPDSGEGGFFLEQNLSEAKATPSGSLLTVLSGATGSVGSISNRDATGARTLFTSLISSLSVHPTRTNYFAYTKPSMLLNGYAFQIAATSGTFTKIIGPLPGLSALPSPDGTLVLYSYVDRGTMRLAILDVATRATTPLPLATLTEKCTWTIDSLSVYCGVPTALAEGLPDFWYQGAVTFSDRLWRIDMADRIATLVVDPASLAGIAIDAVALHVDPRQDVLLFTDKHNSALWAYDL